MLNVKEIECQKCHHIALCRTFKNGKSFEKNYKDLLKKCICTNDEKQGDFTGMNVFIVDENFLKEAQDVKEI